MKAYHGSQKLKDQVIAELQAHYDADNFIKGKGCAVGCLLKNVNGNHIEYEEKFGLPVYMAEIEDTIFEGLPNNLAEEWPILFMSSFEVGKDYSDVVWEFLRWLLLDYLLPKVTKEGGVYDDVRAALKQSAEVLNSNNAAAAARAASRADAHATYAAASRADAHATYAAASRAAASRAAAHADYAASRADAHADYAAASRAAAHADYAAYHADADAASAARAAAAAVAAAVCNDAAYQIFANKLIEFIKKV